MKYYRVKEQADGVTIYRWSDKKHALVPARYLVGNELYTGKELQKLFYGADIQTGYENTILFDPVDIKKSDIFWNFGCRFQCH